LGVRFAKLFDDVRINFGRCRKVKEADCREIFFDFEFGEPLGERGIGLRIRIVTSVVMRLRRKRPTWAG